MLNLLLSRRPMLYLAISVIFGSSGFFLVPHDANSTSPSTPIPAASYVVAPKRISPEHGALSSTPTFIEPTLVLTQKGLVTAFIENKPGTTEHLDGWACASPTGAKWSCTQLSLGPGGTSWSDPWLADTHGDPCPTYGNGITLSVLLGQPGVDISEPAAYYSPDYGKTWVGPEVLSWPHNLTLPAADGTKVIYTGRTYLAWRDDTYLTGEYISQLQTSGGQCSWGEPIRLTTWTGSDSSPQPGYDDGSDHPRLAATPENGGVAARGSFGDALMTFHRFAPDQTQEASSIIGPASYPQSEKDLCPNNSDCPHPIYDLGQSLFFVQNTQEYFAVFLRNDVGGGDADGVGLWSTRSTDNGITWSSPDELAGPSIDHSYAIMQPTMTFDKSTGDVLLSYIEIPSKQSYAAYVELQVLPPGASAWNSAQNVRTFNYGFNSTDYYGFQAGNGVAHVVHSLSDQPGSISAPPMSSYIEYFSVRYSH